ncbi:MAG: hypothetical protein ACFFEF_12150 [Candidatus Thorarchaeota archaeon]
MVREKLVRDGIPDLIRSSGEEPNVRIAKGEELDRFFRAKIVEEANELLETGSMDEVVDLIETLEAFMKFRKADDGLVEMQRHAKKLARGGFDKGYILQSSE